MAYVRSSRSENPKWPGACVLIALALCGCLSPASRVDQIARESGFERKIVEGASFAHVVYRKPGEPARGIHVYIEHDGVPWWNEATVSPDPTPRNPSMLRLMALDPAAALYLGRPCYFGLASTPPCSPLLWTHERYSAEVVHSMAAALRGLLPRDAEVVFSSDDFVDRNERRVIGERQNETRSVRTA